MSNLLRIFFVYFFFATVFAQNPLEFTGVIQKHLPQHKNSSIRLSKIHFTPEAHEKIVSRLKHLKQNPPYAATKHHAAINLGMNNVPVLNQGQHTTSMTFALTAAIDAIIDKGDYISQLCLLTLGQYLSQHSYAYSGWEEIFPKELASRIQEHGVISKASQMTDGCAGLNEYPLSFLYPRNEMTIEDYDAKAQAIDELSDFDSTNLLDIFQFLLEETPRNNILMEVKNSLESGDRLVMTSILIADENLSLWGTYHEKNDTWVYLPESKNSFEQYETISVQSFVIIGYDDEAISIDKDGQPHQGLLILRNSWGPNVGDHGNFYMSYDYFNAFAFDILRIRNLFI